MASGWGGWPRCPLNIARWVVLKRDFAGWRAAVFTGNPACGRHLRLRAHKVHKLYNGALLCELFILNCTDHRKTKSPPLGGRWRRSHVRKPYAQESAASMPLGCAQGYRLLPSLRCRSAGNNLAIDLYQNGARWLQVQEYEAPVTVDQRRARSRLNNALAVTPPILTVPLEHVFLNQQRRSGASMRDLVRGDFHAVREGGHRFLVNFTDHLDTGLFLDQRATVYAAKDGARSTTSVDMSRTYLD
jgi:23S rRNA (guanine2445-N2)-methyltransferase / 23S rRNA (guanine2069-N7)-methyltransferase